MPHARTAAAQPQTGGRRDAFTPLLANPVAALFREHDEQGAATHPRPLPNSTDGCL